MKHPRPAGAVTPGVAIKRWLKDVGLSVTGKPSWHIQVVLLTTGKLPPKVWPARARPTMFGFGVSDSWWWVSLEHEGKKFGWQDSTEEGPHHNYTTWTGLEPPTGFAEMFDWLAGIEAQIGKTFRRDRPSIQSNVKGGAAAIKTWLLALPKVDA